METEESGEGDSVIVGSNPLTDIIEEALDLPFKTVRVSERGNIITQGKVEPEHINALADITMDEERSTVRVKFSIWEDSGQAASLDRGLFIGSRGSQNIVGKKVGIFDPYDVRVWFVGEDEITDLVSAPNGYFWQVARLYGHNRLCSRFQRDVEESELQITYQGLIRFDEPIQRGFGINNEVDLYVGDFVFEVSVV